MFDYDFFDELPDGEEKLRYLKKCIDEADREKDYTLALDLRYEYIKESVFNGDCYKAVIMFPEYMSLFDKHPDDHDRESFMIAFKWIIEDIGDFYQVTRDMAESYFDEFKKRCEMYGYSLRTYYMKKMLFYVDSNPKKAKELHELFRKSERDSLSDCEACELSHDIRMELKFGSEEKAVAMLNTMLSKGISCGEVPEVTFGECVKHFTKIGSLYDAEHYASLLMPMIRGNDNFLMEVSHIILLKSVTEPNEAFTLFCDYFENYLRSRNPKMRFYFEDAAARFFSSISDEEHTCIEMRLPHSFELYSENGEYSLPELIDYFRNSAKDAADKFAKRNGDNFYNDMLNFEYPMKPVKALSLPNHSTLSRVPCTYGIPLRGEKSFLSDELIIEKIKAIPEIEIKGVTQDEDGLIIGIFIENFDSELIIKLSFNRIHDHLNAFSPAQKITKDEFDTVNESFKYMLVISAVLSDRKEMNEGLVLLKICRALNTDNSPFILTLVDYKLLSFKWIDYVTENNIPLFGETFYNISPYNKSEGIIVTVGGLYVFGSRNLIIEGVKEENLQYVCRILKQIADYITDIGKMPDENIEAEFGVVYNNESRVMFGWKLPNSVYDGEYLDYEDALEAVPYIAVTINGKEEKLLLNEITEEIGEKLDFMNSRFYDMKMDYMSNKSFKTAFDAMEENDILIVGFEADLPPVYAEEYGKMAAVYASVIKGISPLKGIIETGIEEVPELSPGTDIIIPDNRVFFWRLERNGEYYFAEEAYLLT